MIDRLLGNPAVRNALGLHSPSRCAAGAPGLFVAAFEATMEGTEPPPWSCGCSCRRCRRAHRPDSPPGLVLREEVAAAKLVAQMRQAADEYGITDMFGPIPHEPGSCEECDRRRDEQREA